MVSIPNQTRASRKASALAAASLLFGAGSAQAELEAGVTLAVSRTDNVFLAPEGEETGDRFYRVSPFIRWTKESPTLDALLDYRYDFYQYDETDIDQSYSFLDANVTGKAMEEALKLLLGASRRQVLRNPNQDVLPGQAPVSGNLQDLDQWYVAPSFDRTFGGRTTLQLGYRYTVSQFEVGNETADGTQREDETQNANFRLNNYAAGQGLTWAARYDFIRTDYEVGLPFEYQIYGLELGYWVSSNVRIFGGAGRESQWNDPIDRSPQDPYWEAGLAYNAGDKISALVAAGERSFGSSIRGSVTYNFRQGNMSLSYSEQPTTEGFNRRRDIDPINPQDPDDFLTDPGVAERYISNRLDWRLSVAGRRTNIDFGLFAEERTGRFSAVGEELPDQDQRGLTTRLSWQAGVKTTVTLDASLINRDLVEESSDDFVRATFTLGYRLGARTVASLSHIYTDQDPGETGLARPYTANTTTLSLTVGL